jgi:RHS repeat-associated protein/fimbrial isopeptide formation D2 family protein
MLSVVLMLLLLLLAHFAATVRLANADSVARTVWTKTSPTDHPFTLTSSDGVTWAPMTSQYASMSLCVTAPLTSTAVLTANADMFQTSTQTGINQDLGIAVTPGSTGCGGNTAPSTVPVIWKESGGGTQYNPASVFVQTVYTMQAGTTYGVALLWKTNTTLPNGIVQAGAHSVSPYSPTTMSAVLAPAASNTVISGISSGTSQPSFSGTSWRVKETSTIAAFTPSAEFNAVIVGNADVFTTTEGVNQDVGLCLAAGTGVVSVPDPCPQSQVIAWQENGGYAAYRPIAAGVRAHIVVTPGINYKVGLVVRTNQSSGTANIGAGGNPWSKSSVIVQLFPSADGSTYYDSQVPPQQLSRTMQYGGADPGGQIWTPLGPSVTVTPTVGSLAVMDGNASLFTTGSHFHPDEVNPNLGICVSEAGGPCNIVGWKESGGQIAFSPDATLVQLASDLKAQTQYTIKLMWATNTPVPASVGTVTMYSGAGGGGVLTPTSLGVTLIPHPLPTVSKSVSASTASVGDQLTYTVTVTNPSSAQPLPLEKVYDEMAPPGGGLASANPRPASVTLNGSDCTTGSPVLCSISQGGTSLTVLPVTLPALTLNPSSSLVLTYTATVTGSARQCSLIPNQAEVDTPSSDKVFSNVVNVTACESGLGLEPWWSYTDQAIGPAGKASVNVGNGNLVVQQTDGQPVQAHGRLAYVLRRTYNSQDNPALTLPGSIGAGWSLNVGQADGLAGDGLMATGLYIPSTADVVQQVANPLAVTYVDRDGTRHLFTPRAIPVVSVSGLTGAQAVLAPLALPASPPGTEVRVDQVFDPPPGVHVGLWRYIEVNTTTNAKKVIGYGAERTDRVRYEFAADGRLLDMVDSAGVELRYVYESSLISGLFPRLVQVYEPRSCPNAPGIGQVPTPPTSASPPSPSTCRSFEIQYSSDNQTISVWDPAGGVNAQDASGYRTVYHLDGASPRHLMSVDNPDGSKITYTYGNCGPSPDQLCSVTDLHGTVDNRATGVTRFSYTANPVPNAPPRIDQVTDRRGNVTAISYDSATSANVDLAGHRHRYSSIDAYGRVGQLDEGNTSGSGAYLHTTRFTWDTDQASCRQPETRRDNNLCRTTRYFAPGSPGSPPTAAPSNDEDTFYLYNQEGALLRERRSLGANNPAQDVACSLCLDTTSSYHVQYLRASGPSQEVDDRVKGSGLFLPFQPRPTGIDSLFPVYDRTEQLTPRGNDPAIGADQPCLNTVGWRCFLMTSVVDRNPAASPNKVETGTSATCVGAGNNTGAVCEVNTPLDDPVPAGGTPKRATTRYTYDNFGQKVSMTTPKAVDEALTGKYTYAYYSDSDLDLSGNVSAGGWLKAITDPTGAYVYMAYDRAGNVARTWDRNATASAVHPVGPFDTNTTGFSETVHGGMNFGSYSRPWRYVVAAADPLGNRTTTTLDANGNQLSVTSPRGNAAGNSSFDVTRTFDPADNVLTVQNPVEAPAGKATVNEYDAFNNVVKTTDPNGHVRAFASDAVDRPTLTTWSRDVYDAAHVPTGCRARTGADTAFPAGSLTLCSTAQRYDALDNALGVTDANGHETTFVFDPAHRQTKKFAPRNDGTFSTLETDTAYDRDGHVVDVYPPRGFAEGPLAAFDTHSTYDVGGRLTQKRTQRTAAQSVTTSMAYDADGNQTVLTDGNGHSTISVFDVLDRQTSFRRQRDAISAHDVTTAMNYDAVGNKTAITAPGSLITAYAFDRDNRVTDEVAGADSAVASLAGQPDSNGGKNIRRRTFYDPDGNVVAVLDPRAFQGGTATPASSPYVVRTDYDADGRPTIQWIPYSDPSTAIPAGLAQPDSCPIPMANKPVHTGGVPDFAANTRVCTTQLQYDPAGNRSTVILPTSGTPATTPVSNPTDNRYVSYTYTHDNLEAVVAAPSPANGGARIPAKTTYYNGAGQPLTIVDGLNHPTSATYFDDGLLNETTDYNGPVGHTTRYTYDANGNRKSVFDGKQHTTDSTYFNDSLLKDATDPVGDKTSYVYDGIGKPLAVVSPSANVKEANNFAYQGSCPGYTVPNTGTPTCYSYTFDGLLLTEAVPVASDGSQLRRTSYQYDGAGRKICDRVDLVAPLAGALTCTQGQNNPSVQSFYYYDDGRLQSQGGRSATGTISYAYDPAGNRTSATDSTSGKTVFSSFYLNDLVSSVCDSWSTSCVGRSTLYSYDGAGSVLSQAEDGGQGGRKLTSYTYSEAEMLASLNSTAAAGTTTFTYDNGGQPQQELGPTGTQRTYDFYGDGTLHSVATKSSANNNISTWTYGYDENYQQTSQSFSGLAASGSGTLVTDTLTYQYDDARRVKQFQQGSTAKAITYDRNGNRTAYGPNLTWTYNADNSIAGARDANAVVSKNLPYTYFGFGGVADDGCSTYTYDGFDRIHQVVGKSVPGRCQAVPNPGTTYAYDALDRQISHTETPGTTELHYAGLTGAVVAVKPVAGGELAYEVGPAGDHRALTQAGAAGNTQFLHDDGHGNISTVSNASAANKAVLIACTARFDPYGTPLTASAAPPVPGTTPPICNTGTQGAGGLPTSTLNEFFYKGGRLDTNTNDYQFGSRTYDPSKAGFLTPDSYRAGGSGQNLSVGIDPLTQNRYSFVNGDPVNLSDPSGHTPCDIHPEKCSANGQREAAGDTSAPCDQRCKLQSQLAELEAEGPRHVNYNCGWNLGCIVNQQKDQFFADREYDLAMFQVQVLLSSSSLPQGVREVEAKGFAGAAEYVGEKHDAIHSGDPLKIAGAVAGVVLDVSTLVPGAGEAVGASRFGLWLGERILPKVASVGAKFIEFAAPKVGEFTASVVQRAGSRFAAEGGGAASVRLGQAGEAAVRGAYDIGPKVTAEIGGRTRIFDGLNGEAVSEVKNVARQSLTQQVRDDITYAREKGLRFDLYVRPGTEVSGPLSVADLDPLNPLNIRYIP